MSECRYPCDCDQFDDEHCSCMEGHAAPEPADQTRADVVPVGMLDAVRDDRDRYKARAEAAEATVARVRAYLAAAETGADAWGTTGSEWLRIRELRAALDGDR